MSFIECRELIQCALNYCPSHPDQRTREELEIDIKDIKLILNLHQQVKDFYSSKGIKNKNFFIFDHINQDVIGLANHYKPTRRDEIRDNQIHHLANQLESNYACCFNSVTVSAGDERIRNALTRYLEHSIRKYGNVDTLEHELNSKIQGFVPVSINALLSNGLDINFDANYAFTMECLTSNSDSDLSITYTKYTSRSTDLNAKIYDCHARNKNINYLLLISIIIIGIILMIIAGVLLSTITLGLFAVIMGIVLVVTIIASTVTYKVINMCYIEPNQAEYSRLIRLGKDYDNYPIVPSDDSEYFLSESESCNRSTIIEKRLG